jgi:hypothetical protein
MLTGSLKSFYRARQALLILAIVVPLGLLLGGYLLVTQVLLLPGVPDAETPPADVFAFIAHPKGLPRLAPADAEAFVDAWTGRLLADDAARETFLRTFRTASITDQEAFIRHLFLAIKPQIMRDVSQFHELGAVARDKFIDDRIVAYNARAAAAEGIEIDADPFRGLPALDPRRLTEIAMELTTESERNRTLAYGSALEARVNEILANPNLKADFEARIATARAQ